MSLAILFHFLCAQHVSDINIVNILCYCEFEIARTLVRCVLGFQCGCVGVVNVLQAEAQLVCSCGIWGLGVNDHLK